jgi:hypothetical protein
MAAKRLISLWLFVIPSVVSLYAGSIGPNCATCFGSIYSLDAELKHSNATTEVWSFMYAIDSSGYNGPAVGKYITAVAAKISSKKVTPLTLETNVGGVWLPLSGQSLSNLGCLGSGGAGWLCLQGLLSGAQVGSDTVYKWNFTVKMAAGSLLDSPKIQANYDPALKVMMSEHVALFPSVAVPEGAPVELPGMLISCGVFLWWAQRRAKLSRRSSP